MVTPHMAHSRDALVKMATHAARGDRGPGSSRNRVSQ